jgi:hypothetical protein
MKRSVTIMSIFTLILSGLILSINTTAKVYKKNWYNCLKVAKGSIYSLGCNLAHEKPYYPLRGKNWVYSGDTFGFEYGDWWGYNKKGYFDIKFQIKIIKGTGKIYPHYIFVPSGNYLNKITNIERVHSSENCWGVSSGKIRVVSKNGCNIQLLLSIKPTTSKKWKTIKINIKVKKKALF